MLDFGTENFFFYANKGVSLFYPGIIIITKGDPHKEMG